MPEITPADFELGSPESKAAARVMLLRMASRLTTDDRDALEIVRMSSHLSPARFHQVKDSAQWQRGLELEARDLLADAVTALVAFTRPAEHEFQLAHGRSPEKYDTLRYGDLQPLVTATTVATWMTAWSRQFPEVTFPFSFTDGLLLCDGEPRWPSVPRWRWGRIVGDSTQVEEHWLAHRQLPADHKITEIHFLADLTLATRRSVKSPLVPLRG